MPARVRITPWPDPVLDVLGHDPRSWYAETFWLPTLGPTALLLLRHLADRFEQTPEGVELPVADTAAALGLGARDGEQSPLVRSLNRLQQFELACADDDDAIAVRRTLPPVHRRHVRRLPVALQARHEEWVAGQSRTTAGRRSHAAAPGASRSRCSCKASRSTPSSARCTAAASIPRSATKPCAGRAAELRRHDRSPTTTPTSRSVPSLTTGHCPRVGTAMPGRALRDRPAPTARYLARRDHARPDHLDAIADGSATRPCRRPHRAPGSRPSPASPTSAARTACGRRTRTPRRPRRCSTTCRDPEIRRRAWQNRLQQRDVDRASRTPRTARSSSSSARARCTCSSRRTSTACTTRAGQSPEIVVEIHGNVARRRSA